MKKILLLIAFLFSYSSTFSQVFVADSVFTGYNFYLGIGIGQGQLNIERGSSTFGRTSSVPRLSVETGIIYRAAPDQHYSLSFRLSYQTLYLHPKNKNTLYNDRLTFLDAQLKPMLHFGGKRFMVLLGASLRYPITSKFEVRSFNPEGENEWYPLSNALKPRKINIVPELGIKVKFANAQIGFITSFTKGNSFENKSNLVSYSIDDAYYYTLEALFYLPLDL